MSQQTKRQKKSSTKIIPPKKNKTEGLSRDEIRSLNKKRIKRKRKLKKLVSLFLLTLVVLSACVLLALTVFFKISTVQITGSKVYSDSVVIEKCGIETGISLFLADEDKLNEELPKSLPYIKNVKIKRKLPDTLIIEVFPTREIAAFQYSAGYILVDETGKVLNRNASMLRENVAVVTGASLKSALLGDKISINNEQTTDNFISILAGLKNSGLSDITEINLSSENEFKLIYQDRITIKLGTMQNIETKLQRAKVAIDKENKINPYSEGVLDLKTEPYAYFKTGADEAVTISPVFVTDENGEMVTNEAGEYVTVDSSSMSENEKDNSSDDLSDSD